MTTREFIMHLLLNCELDDPVYIEVKIDDAVRKMAGFRSFEPAHASRITGFDDPQTLIECKPLEE